MSERTGFDAAEFPAGHPGAVGGQRRGASLPLVILRPAAIGSGFAAAIRRKAANGCKAGLTLGGNCSAASAATVPATCTSQLRFRRVRRQVLRRRGRCPRCRQACPKADRRAPRSLRRCRASCKPCAHARRTPRSPIHVCRANGT